MDVSPPLEAKQAVRAIEDERMRLPPAFILSVFCPLTECENVQEQATAAAYTLVFSWTSSVAFKWRPFRLFPHNPKVGGSNPPPATNLKLHKTQAFPQSAPETE